MKTRALLLAVALLAAAHASAGTRVWKGGANGNWSNPANWDGGVPMPGDDVIITASTKSINDLPDGLVLHSLTAGSAVQVSGNAIVLGEGGLFTSGEHAAVLALDLRFANVTLGASQRWSSPSFSTATGVGPTNINGKTLTLSISPDLSIEQLSGTGAVVQEAGATSISVLSTYTGTITVNGGSFRFLGTMGAALVNGGTLAAGSADVASFTIAGGGTLEVHGTVNTGALTFASGGAPAHLVTGTPVNLKPGALYVRGPIELTNAQLTTSVVAIDNDGVDPVVGTFLGIPEGTIFNSSNQSYRVSYVGGDGNDVTFTPLADLASYTYTTLSARLTTQPGRPAPGQWMTFTATAAAVSGAIAGTVTFYDGGVPLGGVPVDATGHASLTAALAPGTHYITAGFGSQSNFAASQATVKVTVVKSRTRAIR